MPRRKQVSSPPSSVASSSQLLVAADSRSAGRHVIVLVASIIDAHGMDGLLIATMMAGLIMVAAGLLRLVALVRHVPHAVTVGFTAGIAVIIFASQLHDLLGLKLSGAEPGELLHKLETLWSARATFNPWAAALAAGTIAIIVAIRNRRPMWPSLLIAVVLASLAAWALQLPVETIGTRFGGTSLPHPALAILPGHWHGQDHRTPTQCRFPRRSWQHRKPSLGCRCRQHDWAHAPLQC